MDDFEQLRRKEEADFTASALKLLQCVFPQGIEVHEKLPLMYVLRQHGMSFRAVARLVGVLLQSDYISHLNDAYHVDMADYIPEPQLTDKLQQRLLESGFLEWLED